MEALVATSPAAQYNHCRMLVAPLDAPICPKVDSGEDWGDDWGKDRGEESGKDWGVGAGTGSGPDPNNGVRPANTVNTIMIAINGPVNLEAASNEARALCMCRWRCLIKG